MEDMRSQNGILKFFKNKAESEHVMFSAAGCETFSTM